MQPTWDTKAAPDSCKTTELDQLAVADTEDICAEPMSDSCCPHEPVKLDGAIVDIASFC